MDKEGGKRHLPMSVHMVSSGIWAAAYFEMT